MRKINVSIIHIQNTLLFFFSKCYLKLSTVFSLVIERILAQSVKKKKRNINIYFNTNYHTQMKLISIIKDYCLLQSDALKSFLGIRLHGGSLPIFNFFNVNSQIFQQNRKILFLNCLDTNFHNIPIISLNDSRRRDYN